MATIKPGISADIIFEGDESCHAIQTTIHHVAGPRVILSPNTPLTKDYQLGKRLLVSFLEKSEVGNDRYVFWAKLTELLTDYELTPSQYISALVIEIQTDPKKNDLRTSYRIGPLSNKDLTVFLQGVEVDILDISVGGIRISTSSPSLNPHDKIKLTINIDNNKFDVGGRIIKVWSSQKTVDKAGHQQAAIQFLDHQKERDNLLGGKIFRLDRERLAKRMR